MDPPHLNGWFGRSGSYGSHAASATVERKAMVTWRIMTASEAQESGAADVVVGGDRGGDDRAEPDGGRGGLGGGGVALGLGAELLVPEVRREAGDRDAGPERDAADQLV